MRQIGKKGKEWIKARARLVKEAIAEGRIEVIDGVIQGICEDCDRWKHLTPDHVVKRSLGGSHEKSNINWVCLKCHNFRDNMGDPKKKKPKSKKPDWAKPHRCKRCRTIVSLLICPNCGEISI